MTKDSEKHESDCEAGSMRYTPSKLGAVLCPAACALVLVCVFAAAFLATRLAWERYDAFCTKRRYDFQKLYVFSDANITMQIQPK